MIIFLLLLLNVYSLKDLFYLKKIVIVGEVCILLIVVKWVEKNERRFFNVYGLIEVIVCVICFEFILENKYEDVNCDLLIGIFILGVDVYLFDDYMKFLFFGVIGEIYIGGFGFFEGYYGYVSYLIKERFV